MHVRARAELSGIKRPRQLAHHSPGDAIVREYPINLELNTGSHDCRIESFPLALELSHLVQELLQGIVVNFVRDGRDERLGLLSAVAAK